MLDKGSMLYVSCISRFMALNMILANGSPSSVLLLFDMVLISLNLFVHKRASSTFIALLVYVNDIIIYHRS